MSTIARVVYLFSAVLWGGIAFAEPTTARTLASLACSLVCVVAYELRREAKP